MSESGLTHRRRDWTPWEFERASRNLAHELGCSLHRVETGPVEERRTGGHHPAQVSAQ